MRDKYLYCDYCSEADGKKRHFHMGDDMPLHLEFKCACCGQYRGDETEREKEIDYQISKAAKK